MSARPWRMHAHDAASTTPGPAARPVARSNVAASSARSTDHTVVTHSRSTSSATAGQASSTSWPRSSSACAVARTAASTAGAVSTPKNE